MNIIFLLPLFLCATRGLGYELNDFTKLNEKYELPSAEVGDLHYVYVLMREGMRVPAVPMPTNTPFSNKWGPYKGQLTVRGDHLMRFVSQVLVNRYKTFLVRKGGKVAVSYSRQTDEESGVYPPCEMPQASASVVESVIRERNIPVETSHCYDYLKRCKNYQAKRSGHLGPKHNMLYSDSYPGQDLYYSELCTIERMRKLYETFVIENFKVAMQERPVFTSARRDYLKQAASKYLRRVSGFYRMHDYVLGRLHHDMHNDLKQEKYRMRIHIADEVITSAFFRDITDAAEYAQYGDAFIIEVGKPPGLLYNPFDKYSAYTIKVFRYSPLEDSRLVPVVDKSLFLPQECTRYLSLNRKKRLCPLKYFRCDHRPFNPHQLEKFCDPPRGYGLMDDPYENQCTDISLAHYRQEAYEKKMKEWRAKKERQAWLRRQKKTQRGNN